MARSSPSTALLANGRPPPQPQASVSTKGRSSSCQQALLGQPRGRARTPPQGRQTAGKAIRHVPEPHARQEEGRTFRRSALEPHVELGRRDAQREGKAGGAKDILQQYASDLGPEVRQMPGGGRTRGLWNRPSSAHKPDPKDSKREHLFAVKEFKQRPGESAKRYQRRLTSEFCISSSMQHPNVINTLDLLQDEKGVYCEVMEYCSGGDLYTLVLAAGQLDVTEADCFFKQLMRGVEYMHEMGVAHRDLKPENMLLTTHGSIKITDFGNGECFRMAWEKEAHMTAGLCGSAPYIAPEEYVDKEFDPRAVDVWACGIIYMAMRTGRHLWRVAQKGEDEFFDRYLEDRKEEEGYRPIEVLRRVSHVVTLILLSKD